MWRVWPIAAAGVVLIVVIYLEPLLYREFPLRTYCVYHTLMEFFGITISVAIFMIAWHSRVQGQTLRGLFLGLTFLIAGVLELFHTLSCPGLPDFITSNTSQKMILFKIWARLLTAGMLLCSSVLPVRRVKPHRRWQYLGGAVFTLVISTYIIIFYSNYFPLLFRAGHGITPLKILLTYVVVLLRSVAAYLYWGLYRKSHDYVWLLIIVALGIGNLGELAFTLYSSLHDTYTLLGHLYEIFARIYIYIALFVGSIKRPYELLSRAHVNLRRAQRLRILGRLASRLAHELKNPLAAIRASAQLGSILDDPKERQRVYQRIEKEVDRLTELITFTLELSRERPEAWELVDIPELIDNVLSLWKAELQKKNITVTTVFPLELPGIQARSNLLQQAFNNLLSNAVDAIGEDGEIRITVSRSDTNETVIIRVTDTGSGIPEKIKERVFNEFFTTKASGTGLGLAITHQIIAGVHLGQIWCDSEEGRGTTFTMQLPVKQE